jgi:hypothetical protein
MAKINIAVEVMIDPPTMKATAIYFSFRLPQARNGAMVETTENLTH